MSDYLAILGEETDGWRRIRYTQRGLAPSILHGPFTVADVSLQSVTNADVVAWVAKMRRDGLSASRIRQAYSLLSSMLDAAVRDRRLATNPAAGVRLPKLPSAGARPRLHRLAVG